MNKRIVGVFAAEYEASRAIEELKRQGCRTEDISIIARNKADEETLRDESGTVVRRVWLQVQLLVVCWVE